MENENIDQKSLTDLIQDPSQISAIINNPAESGMEFYQSLHSKDKSYVAFAAGFGLIAYGLYLARSGRSSQKSTGMANTSGGQNSRSLQATGSSDSQNNNSSTGNNDTQGGSAKELNVKKKK